MVLRPEREATARAIFEKWELDFAVIGQVTDSGHLVLQSDANVRARPDYLRRVVAELITEDAQLLSSMVAGVDATMAVLRHELAGGSS